MVLALIFKDVRRFFTSLVSVTSLIIFYVLMGLILWVFPDYSLLNGYYSNLDSFFAIVPLVLMFLIPALNMNALAQEKESGTIDLLLTRPITSLSIIAAKFISGVIIISVGLLPSLLYVYSIYQLGNPVGNLDMGGVGGSYIGLMLLCMVFTALSIFASSLLNNNISALLFSIVICFLGYWGWYLISSLSLFYGTWDYWVQWLGFDFHYTEMGKGLIRLESLLYFVSVITLFLFGAYVNIEKLKR